MTIPNHSARLRLAKVFVRSLGLFLALSACAILAPGATPTPLAVEPSPHTAVGTENQVPTVPPVQPTETAEAQNAPQETVGGCNPPRPRTVANPEGPFYRPNAPERDNLLGPGMTGTPLVVIGQVLTPDCMPIPGALLDFWQTDSQGNYDNQGFQLRGRQFTDEAGRYRLETILPGEYPGRPPHIHVKVNPPGGAVLTTQIYFAMPSVNGLDDLAHPSLVTDVRFGPDGVLQAEFDFVLHP